ncbi:MAG: ComF family protein [Neisseria sp.]|nr:ComF family protein [Neisseria sp.]
MGMLSRWRGLFGAKRCVLCHDSAAAGLCAACAADLRRLQTDAVNVCPLCVRVSIGGAVCGACQQKPPPFEKLWASVYYEPPLSSMLHAFKHQADLSLLPALAAVMRENPPPWLADVQIDAVLAMPLSKARRLYRGFNQADELAAALAAHYGWPLLPRDAVFRRHHAPQSTLKSDERRQNVQKAFEVQTLSVKNRKLLLIDDVVTTGATLSELARTLKRAGAGGIYGWTLARSQMKKF